MRFLLALMTLLLVFGTTQTSAACRWFGTQLECAFGGSQMLIGTQEMAEPAYVGSMRPQQLIQGSDVLDARTEPGQSLGLELQNVGVDPGICRKWGNETYCY